jgi:RNA polymerase sigma factor (sigma-70 family)
MAKTKHGIAPRHLDTLLNVGAVGGLTDAQLLELFTTGRDETAEVAFTVLVDRHGPMVLRVCQAVLRDSHDAQDAFQATFLVLVKKARGLWLRESLGPWLHQVAHRIASGLRLAKARRRRHEKQAASFSGDYSAASSPDDLGEVLHREVSRLPERYRAAVVLCLLEGLTPEQAAHQLGWPAGTVHSRLARGRERLRGRLTRQGLAPAVAGLGLLRATEPAATVPPALVAATGRAASRVIAGEMMGALVSNSVAALTKGALRTKMMTKLMIAAGATLALGVAITGAGALGYIAPGQDDPSSPQRQQKAQGEPSPKSGPVNAQSQAAPAVGGKGDITQAKPSLPVAKVTKEALVRESQALFLAISPNGKTLAASCTDSSVQLLDARTGEKRVALAGSIRGYIRGLAFTPDGKTIAGTGDDNQLRLWDVDSGQLMKALPAFGNLEHADLRPGANSLAISPDGSLIAVGGTGSTDNANMKHWDDTSFFDIRVLDAKTGELVWSHFGRRGYMDQLAFSPDGQTLASATHGEIRLWDARAGDLKQTLKPVVKSGTIWTLAFSPDNKLLAGYGNARVPGGVGCLLTLWDVRTGAIVRSIDAGPAAGATAPGTLAFSPDSKTVASGGHGSKEGRISIGGRVIGRGSKVINYVKLWNVATGALLWTSAEGDLGLVTSIVFSPDGTSIYCCDSSATTRIDAQTGQTRQDLMKATDGPPR